MKSRPELSFVWSSELDEHELLFGSVKEDSSVEVALLGMHRAARQVVVIASGGCTALSIVATTSVQHLTALDINPAQIYASKLKLASVLNLNVEEACRFNFVDGRPDYERIRTVLEPEVAAFWDRHRMRLSQGLNMAGSVDRRISILRGVFHRLIHSKEFVRRFLLLTDVREQQVLFDRSWTHWRWNAGTRLAFDPRLLKAFFGRGADLTIPADFHRTLRERVRRSLTGSPAAVNPYVWSTFLGEYGETKLPYLIEGGMTTIREHRSILRFATTDFLEWLRRAETRSIDFFSLSNILETATPEYQAAFACEAARTGQEGAIIVMRSIIPQKDLILKHPDLQYDPELTGFATQRDRSCFCNAFQIYRRK
jgi:S-adenosylmethionine:diacylglycerol 3-amino-3-carboxypropyl transferase